MQATEYFRHVKSKLLAVSCDISYLLRLLPRISVFYVLFVAQRGLTGARSEFLTRRFLTPSVFVAAGNDAFSL